MRLVMLTLMLGSAIALTASCASVRTTGPKTSVDRCVDRCDESVGWCNHPEYPSSCGIEYDSCVLRCDPEKKRPATNG